MRHDRRLELALALVVALIIPTAASAQGFTPSGSSGQAFSQDRAGNEGPGFKAGRLVLHPGVSVEGGYDSNVFLQNRDEEDSFILRVTGYFDVATEPPQRRSQGEMNKAEPPKIEFRGGIGGSYYQYFNDRLAPNAAADGHFDLSYNPSKVFSLQVRDQFIRTVRPFTNPDTTEGQTTSYGRNRNTASVYLIGRSKSQVLEGRVGYTNVYEFFDSNVFNYGDNLTHRVPFSLSWSFFPSSALLYLAEYSNQQFDETAVMMSPTLLSDNNRIKNLIGYNGALTERFSLAALIGYTAGFYELVSDFDGVIARVDLRWRPRPTISLAAGYDRDVQPSLVGNFTEINRLFADTSFTLAGAFKLGIQTWVSFDESGLALAPDGTLLGNEPNREDIRVFVGIFGEYRFRSWLALFAQASYLADFTDFEYSGADPLLDPAASYQRFDAWMGIRVFY